MPAWFKKVMPVLVGLLLCGCESKTESKDKFKGATRSSGRASEIIGKKCTDQYEKMPEKDRAFIECADGGGYFYLTYKKGKPSWKCYRPKKLVAFACSAEAVIGRIEKFRKAQGDFVEETPEQAAGIDDTVSNSVRLLRKVGDKALINCWEGQFVDSDYTFDVVGTQALFPNEKRNNDDDECAVFSNYVFGNLCNAYQTGSVGNQLQESGEKAPAKNKDPDEKVVDDDDLIKDEEKWNANANYGLDNCVKPLQ